MRVQAPQEEDKDVNLTPQDQSKTMEPGSGKMFTWLSTDKLGNRYREDSLALPHPDTELHWGSLRDSPPWLLRLLTVSTIRLGICSVNKPGAEISMPPWHSIPSKTFFLGFSMQCLGMTKSSLRVTKIIHTQWLVDFHLHKKSSKQSTVKKKKIFLR